MGAQQKRPLRQLTPQEREELSQKATSAREQVIMGKKAKALLAVADGCTFTEAGRQVGMSRDGVSQLVERFHQRGVEVLSIAPGRGRKPTYTSQDHKQILQEVQRCPTWDVDQCTVWSLSFFAKVLACQRIFRHLPENDPSGLAGTWMEVPADNTHLASH